MIDRRTWIQTVGGGIAAFLLSAFTSTKRAEAATHQLDAATLKYVLRVGRDEDKAFIDRVVAMMKTGKLPRSIVEKCFLWARRKRKNKFEYFKRALIALAKYKGITVK